MSLLLLFRAAAAAAAAVAAAVRLLMLGSFVVSGTLNHLEDLRFGRIDGSTLEQRLKQRLKPTSIILKNPQEP